MSIKMPSPLKAISVAAALCMAGGAQAAITVYTTQTDFVNAVYAPGYDTYDDLPAGSLPDSIVRNAGTYTYTAASTGGLYGAGGLAGDYWLSNLDQISPITFQNFSGGVSAFGGYFFPTDAPGNYTYGNVVLTALDGSTFSYSVPGATTGSFIGFVSDAPLTAVTLSRDGGDYWPTANNVILAVPEPATYGMLLAGLGLVGVAARRRRG